MKVLSPSSNGKPETDSNNINNPSRSSELVGYQRKQYQLQRLIFISLLKYMKLKNLTSSLVRLGEERRTNRKEHN